MEHGPHPRPGLRHRALKAAGAAAFMTALAQPLAMGAAGAHATPAPASQAQQATQQAAQLSSVPPGLLDQGLVLMRQAAQSLAPPGARVVVTAGAPDSRLKLAPCAAGTASLVPGLPAWGHTRLALRCTQGAPWNIQIPVKVQVHAPAVVAAAALSSGTVLAGSHLAVAEVDWAAHGAPPSALATAQGQASLYTAVAALEARQLARPVTAGAPVRPADLQARQWFAAGAAVSVVALGNGFTVVAEGQALQAGLEGQLVRVRTDNGRVLAGRPTGERRVEVRL